MSIPVFHLEKIAMAPSTREAITQALAVVEGALAVAVVEELVMSFFTEDDFKRIEKSILEAESKTDAEIVAVFARRSDNYYYIPTLVAAVVALVTPSFLMLTPYWLEMGDLLLIQAGLFLCLGLLLRLKPFMSLIIPKFTKARRCNLMARYQFLENNLHTTKDNLGVLIFRVRVRASGENIGGSRCCGEI